MPNLPEQPDHNAVYWNALRDRHLMFPRCRQCAHAWLPVSNECPNCLVSDWAFETASGDASLLSWVVYYHAYHEKWADRIPYTVGLVQLAEGPRLMTNIVGIADAEDLDADQPLRIVFEEEDGVTVPRFTTVEGSQA